jgi:ACT domain-containing protein
LKVLRAKYQDYDDIFIDVDKPTNEINPITINQTININKAVSSTISIMNIEKNAKVKTNKSKIFDLFDSDEE